MKIRLRRIRHPWMLVGILFLVALVAIEVSRLLWAQQAVDQAAHDAARYAVTGQFDPQYCLPEPAQCDSSNPNYNAAAFDTAREKTIKDVARQGLNGLPLERLKLVVCSSRAGFTYDADTGTCLPHDDAGEPADRVMINIVYRYSLGAFIGAGVGDIPLQSTQSMINERYRTVRLQGLPPPANVPDNPTSSNQPASNQTVANRIQGLALPDKLVAQPQTRMIIMNGDLQLIVADADASLAQATAITLEAGGYVVKSEAWSDNNLRHAKTEIRLPAAKFQAVVDRLKQLAIRVAHESATGQDVTEEYVDLEGRLKGLQATADRLQGLLAKAQTTDEALRVSTELGRIQEQIEQVTGRMTYLKNHDELSTITLALDPEQPLPTPTPSPTPTAWQPNVTAERAVNFLGTSARFAGDILIWGMIVLIPIGAMVWIALRLIRRVRAAKQPRT